MDACDPAVPFPSRSTHRRTTPLFGTLFLLILGCQPDESPLKGENDILHKQVVKQESVVVSLQEGNKVMQQQIDLLNQELRDVRKEAQRGEAERATLATKVEVQSAENRKLTADAQRLSAK